MGMSTEPWSLYASGDIHGAVTKFAVAPAGHAAKKASRSAVASKGAAGADARGLHLSRLGAPITPRRRSSACTSCRCRMSRLVAAVMLLGTHRGDRADVVGITVEPLQGAG